MSRGGRGSTGRNSPTGSHCSSIRQLVLLSNDASALLQESSRWLEVVNSCEVVTSSSPSCTVVHGHHAQAGCGRRGRSPRSVPAGERLPASPRPADHVRGPALKRAGQAPLGSQGREKLGRLLASQCSTPLSLEEVIGARSRPAPCSAVVVETPHARAGVLRSAADDRQQLSLGAPGTGNPWCTWHRNVSPPRPIVRPRDGGTPWRWTVQARCSGSGPSRIQLTDQDVVGAPALPTALVTTITSPFSYSCP